MTFLGHSAVAKCQIGERDVVCHIGTLTMSAPVQNSIKRHPVLVDRSEYGRSDMRG